MTADTASPEQQTPLTRPRNLDPLIRVPNLDTFLPPAPTLAECLETAPPWYVASLAPHDPVPPAARSATSTAAALPVPPAPAGAAEIIRCLTTPLHLRPMLADLDPLEAAAFFLVGAFNAGRGVPIEQCWAILADITGHRHRRFAPALDSLRRRGLVFVGHHNYRSVYFIPPDVRRAAEEGFFRPMIARRALPPDALRPLPHPPTALRDMNLFLLAAAKGEIRLTQEGAIYRRQQLRLARLLGWPIWGASRRPTPGHGYPAAPPVPGHDYPSDRPALRQDHLAARLSLLWNYALSRGLVEAQAGSAVITPEVETWFDLPWGKRWVDMAEETLRDAASWHQNIFTALQILLWAPPGAWLDLGDAFPGREQTVADGRLAATAAAPGIRRATTPDRYSSAGALRPAAQWVHRLQYLGLLEQAEKPDAGHPPLRLTPLGRAFLQAVWGERPGVPSDLLPADETSFIVAPNFEVVAPFTIHARLLMQLGTMAELLQADQALVFHINRDSVYRALKEGMTAETILEVLRKGCRQRVPQNVEATIREWASAYGQVWLARFHLLRCADPQVAARIQASPLLQPFLAGQLTPRDLILREGDLRPLMDALEREGFLPRAGVELAPPREPPTPGAGVEVAPPRDPAMPPARGGEADTASGPHCRRSRRCKRGPQPLDPIRLMPADWLEISFPPAKPIAP